MKTTPKTPQVPALAGMTPLGFTPPTTTPTVNYKSGPYYPEFPDRDDRARIDALPIHQTLEVGEVTVERTDSDAWIVTALGKGARRAFSVTDALAIVQEFDTQDDGVREVG